MAEVSNLDTVDISKGVNIPKSLSNVFENALQNWTQIDLPSLQKKLDEQGLELKDEQKSSLLSRKNLASKTKEFKKLPDSEKLEEVKPLLKLYQNEIDQLTTKRKAAENYFFAIYRLLAEAPDPKPLLELSIDAVSDSLETENLKKELAKLNDELSKKADYDQLKQRLLRSEQNSAELLTSKVRAKEDELKAIFDEKESNWAQKEKGLLTQIEDAKKKIEELRTSKEVTELQLNSQQNNTEILNSSSVLAELDIVSRDAESSKKRIFELEKRNEDLRRELSISKNDVKLQSLQENYNRKVSELEGENAILAAHLEQTRKKLDTLSKESVLKSESFTREVNQLTTEIKTLKEKLDSTQDYDELKHELNLLRQIEFGQDEENPEGDADTEINSIIIQRNKALTKELADYRSQFDDLRTRIQQLEGSLNDKHIELERAQQLNEKLENDLADYQEATNGNKFNDNMSIISGMSRPAKSLRNGSIASLPGAELDTSILPIITKQRDRFRDRNQELEDELKKQFNIISDLKRQANSLKKDNEELYERTRYLASFNKSSSASQVINSRSKNAFNPKPNIDIEKNAYQELYESKLHPIEQFRLREQERINSRLSPMERLFISLTRAILATRTTRMLFVVYCLGLHAIVMIITIYSMSLNTTLIPEVGLNVSTGGVASEANLHSNN